MKRICGLESELGTFPKTSAPLFLEQSEYVLCLPEQLEVAKRIHAKNGSQWYLDQGKIEIASAECSNPFDLALITEANMQIISDLADRHGIFAYNNNHDVENACFGCHENYYFRCAKKHNNTEKVYHVAHALSLFLATRILYTGAGMLNNKGFFLSPRAFFTDSIMENGATEKKPFVVPRENEPFSRDGIRLHITCGDNLMSEFANYLRIGTTWIVVCLLENEFIPTALTTHNALEVMAKTNVEGKDASFFVSGRKRTALDIQKEYLDTAHNFFAKKPDLADKITKDVLTKWELVLRVLEKEHEAASKYIDWATKKFLYELALKSRKIDEQQFDLDYHLLGKKGKHILAKNAGLVHKLFTPAQIECAQFFPPKDTRAAYRMWLLKLLKSQEYKITNAGWEFISYVDKEGKRKNISLLNPYACSSDCVSKEL